MVYSIKEDVVRYILRVKVVQQREERQTFENQGGGEVEKKPIKVDQKIGRNDPCPCGSGKKYKNCCGRMA
ncbi:MAG TPA: hypothetical protein DGK91_08455 [Clostridium sp.]|nr:hypothetical protein [Clostridium sp.]